MDASAIPLVTSVVMPGAVGAPSSRPNETATVAIVSTTSAARNAAGQIDRPIFGA
jgi:hypothetical protein